MNLELRHALGEYFAARIRGLLEEKEFAENVLNVLGKPILEEKPKAKQPTQEELNSLKRTEKVSAKGPYQIISKTENPDNPVFEKLQAYITQHGGFVNLHGKKLWTFSNDPTNKIGFK